MAEGLPSDTTELTCLLIVRGLHSVTALRENERLFDEVTDYLSASKDSPGKPHSIDVLTGELVINRIAREQQACHEKRERRVT